MSSSSSTSVADCPRAEKRKPTASPDRESAARAKKKNNKNSKVVEQSPWSSMRDVKKHPREKREKKHLKPKKKK
jgi:hypothetical protein